ncbi:hypothetical protein TVAG_475980 [Trichomonas vaginalis G3]|uniref:CYRIA/CYRIB Rac1 binding domain-containing protein n=1 Tax=Trichomonas vaginalis (strain ATCC PRA-98 / G3) TaxID=412133 RepID=A2DA22_TRIV3|nr:protein of unknown function, DUF1394 family [Trichomonas vaginalis G3]EAY22670.1 hypothetical protein TVAG_475980 [Trichomonas vaginalis G3]KAI5525484.1 protein of unknown function, DUF1394 family [Trichomonas vaginalis G3]|eukprot:XP_001583656.1 hypothetical protein [Trichomonas vaginalis G3]
MLLDLSFYRRTTQRNAANALVDALFVQTNIVSIFLGASTPFLDYLYSQFNHTFANNVPSAVRLLGLIIEVCASNIVSFEMIEPCLKAMTAMILIIDKINGNAFNCHAPYPAYRCLQILFETTPRQDNLINTIRYNSKNLNNEDTLEPIKELFAS